MREGGGVRFKNTIFVVSRSDTYKVSLQQILCSAISRGSGAPKLVLMSGFNLAHAASFRLRVNLKDLCTMLHSKDDAQRRRAAEIVHKPSVLRSSFCETKTPTLFAD